MSWLFSQALVAEYSAVECSVGEPSAPLSVMLTPQQFWRNDKMMDCSKPSLFGLTLRHLTESSGEELLTLFLAAFRAKILAAPEKAQVLKVREAGCGRKWRASLAKFDPNTHTLKTAQCSLIEDSTECLVTLPKWGSMRNGAVYQQPKWVHPTSVKEFGLVPTLTVAAAKQGMNLPDGRRGQTLLGAAKGQTWATPTTMDTLPPKSEKALLREATVARPGRSKPANLRDQVSNANNWPTPRACRAIQSPITERTKDREFFNLETMAAKFPTPTASQYGAQCSRAGDKKKTVVSNNC